MRTIQKQISLEPMTSRLPSVWPAYKNDTLYYFDDKSLEERKWQYTSNWGMLPLSIVLNHNPNELGDDGRPKDADTYNASITEKCHCYADNENSYDEICNFTLSFENLSKWYYFFNEYYNLLKQYSHCNRVYTSAEDYYNYESGEKYVGQMKYGSDKQTYLDLDAEFAEKGGKVEVLVFDKDTSEYKKMTPSSAHDEDIGDRTAMVDVYDIGYFKWICDNIVPSYIIPMKYKDYWNRDRLYYPDVIRWLAWFNERIAKGYETNGKFKQGENGDVDTWECKNDEIEDCCDCEEYFNRGGKRIFDDMKKWYDNIQTTISSNNSVISANTNCFDQTIIVPTELQVSIDDLGEKSIFSTEYKLGVDYRTASSMGANENTNQGTVASMNGNSIILTEGSGYTFDDIYMEKYVSKCLEEDCGYEGVFYGRCPKCGSKNIEVIGWDDYTNHYINNEYNINGTQYSYKNDFYVSAVTFYAFDDDNVRYTTSATTENDARGDLESQMSLKYQLTIEDNGWILIDNELYPIKETEYGTYDSSNQYLGGKKYAVYRESVTNTPYTFINGNKVFGEFDPIKGKFVFKFFEEEFDRFPSDDSPKMYYIVYNDRTYPLNEDTTVMTIDDADCYRISGYCVDNISQMVYVDYDNNIRSGETATLVVGNDVTVSSDTRYFENKPFINAKYPSKVELYRADEIKGCTVSKLADLRLYNVLVDDIGNNIDGIYPMNNSIYNHQPPQGTELEPLYQVGNTANIARFSNTFEDLDMLDNSAGSTPRNYFVGDIITDMKFYYMELDGTIPSATTVDVKLTNSGSITLKGKYINTSVDSGYTSLSAITASTSGRTELEEKEDEVHIFYDDIFCDVRYYVGATLRRLDKKNYNLSYDEHLNNHGVEYEETVRFVKENREYYLAKPKKFIETLPMMRKTVSAHSISYPIYTYKMEQDLKHVDNSQYDSSYDVPMANFKVDINIFSGNCDTFSQKYSGDMATHNNMQVYPTFREEYRMGIATVENVDSDIYIDRGINAAFEKHLKLQEVRSLEALEQFGNGYFKIMEN